MGKSLELVAEEEGFMFGLRPTKFVFLVPDIPMIDLYSCLLPLLLFAVYTSSPSKYWFMAASSWLVFSILEIN